MEEHDEVAERLESEADALKEESERIKGDIDETREDWKSKQQSEEVPGAQPADESDA
jgi:hypothetical protein